MRLIDVDALIPMMKYTTTDNEIGVFPIKIGFDTIVKVINAQPTIEPKPERKKGVWIEQDDSWDGVYYECSVCKGAYTLIDGTPSDNLYNFCPNCGADMRGKE